MPAIGKKAWGRGDQRCKLASQSRVVEKGMAAEGVDPTGRKQSEQIFILTRIIRHGGWGS